MTQPISPQLLLFSEGCLLWACAAYAVSSDPLPGEQRSFQKMSWRIGFFARAVFACGFAYGLSRSWLFAIALFGITIAQPLVRYYLSPARSAEIECTFVAVLLGFLLATIKTLHLVPIEVAQLPLTPEHKGALCILIASLLFSVRGGTYIVRGVLKKAGALPTIRKQTDVIIVDETEYNRGRLIGNLERVILAIVAAAGSYAALGFLIAAKGLVRFEGGDHSRDFTEYFLIGSLTSVLIALCTGLLIRFFLLAFWPELLSLQMQP